MNSSMVVPWKERRKLLQGVFDEDSNAPDGMVFGDLHVRSGGRESGLPGRTAAHCRAPRVDALILTDHTLIQ